MKGTTDAGGAAGSAGTGGSDAGGLGGTGGSAGDDGSTGACGKLGPNKDPTCDACRRKACCNEANDCLADPDCKKWLECEDACAPDNGGCLKGCWSGTPGPAAKAAYAACKQRSCGDVCGAKACSGPSFGYQDSGLNDACSACQNVHCCDQIEQCTEDADCTKMLECYSSCPDPSCFISKCNSAEYKPTMSKLSNEWACRNRYCLDECTDSDMDCSVVFVVEDKACAKDNCCAQIKACADDPECLQHTNCQWACTEGIQECHLECDKKYWIGAGLGWPMRYCMKKSSCSGWLATSFSAKCGGFAYAGSNCKTCTEQSCCAEGEACGTNPACAGIEICVEACGTDTACKDKCLAIGLPGGATLHQALTSCQSTNCSSSCG